MHLSKELYSRIEYEYIFWLFQIHMTDFTATQEQLHSEEVLMGKEFLSQTLRDISQIFL
jgi:hypothetical protein